jgi:hypothetical protein
MQRVRDYLLTPQARTVWASLDDIWLQVAAAAFVLMYLARDVVL